MVSPVLEAILLHQAVTPKLNLAVEKMSKVVNKYKFSCYREIIYFMRDLKAKNVFNFSRSRIYSKLSRSTLVYDT